MKKITIDGREFEYKVFRDCNEHGDWEWTEFYQGTEIRKYKRFIFFGKTIKEVVPKLIFEISINIEDSCYTKEDIRKKLSRQVELLNRAEEINRGEII